MEEMAFSNLVYWIKKLDETFYAFSRHNETLVPLALSFRGLGYRMSHHKKTMRKDLLTQYEKDLIHEISLTSDGIGSTKAGFIAEHFEDVQAFLKADAKELATLVNAKKSPVLNDAQVKALMLTKAEVKQGLNIQETWVYFLSKAFIRDQVNTVQSMSFEDLDINPLLAKVLALSDPKDIIRFNLYQSITRSIVTSWGMRVEKILKYSGCELENTNMGVKGRKADLKKIIGDKVHYLQIKSGPNTMNVNMVESLNDVIDEIEKKGYFGLLGMTYGRRERISNQILGNLKDAKNHTKIGRELWDFISETCDYHKKVITVIDSATQKELKASFIQLIENKINDFTKVWEQKFSGRQINEVLEEYM